MADKLNEGKHAGEHVLSEVGMISRDQVTIDNGDDLEAGTVLEKSGTKWVKLSTVANAAAILFDKAKAASEEVQATAHTRLCEVADALLVWPDSISDNDKATAIAALADSFIIVRTVLNPE